MDTMNKKCEHCGGTGTCTQGKEGNSCRDCAKKSYSFAFLRKKETLEDNKGLICRACEGSGEFDPRTKRLHQNIRPFLGLIIIIASLFLISDFANKESKYFEQVLPFLSALVGSVTTYYFTNNSNKTS